MFFDDDNVLDYGEDEFEAIENENNLLEVGDVEIETNTDVIPNNYDDNCLEINCLEEEENFINCQMSSEGQNNKVESVNTQVLSDLNNANGKGDEKNDYLSKEKVLSSSFKAKDTKCKPSGKKIGQYHRSFDRTKQARKNGSKNFDLHSPPLLPKFNNFNNKTGKNFKKFYSQQGFPHGYCLSQNPTNSQNQYNAPHLGVSTGVQQWPSFIQAGNQNKKNSFLCNQRNQLWFPRMPVPQFERSSNNMFPRFMFNRQNFRHKKGYERNIQDRPIEPRFEQNRGIDTDPETILKNQTLKAEEKKKIELQKEARMKRFINDFDRSKDNDKFSNPELVKKTGFRLGNNHEVKSTKEEISFPKNDQKFIKNVDLNIDFTSDEPKICKEILMKKKNPFASSSDIILTNSALPLKEDIELENQMKKVFHLHNQIFESFDVKPLPVKNKEGNFLTSLKSDPDSLQIVKKDDSNVSFVRTISKTFEELSFLKNKSNPSSKNIDSQSGVTSPLPKPLVTNLRNSSCLSALKTQEESQLIGCIVKVLNVPDSICTNDILAMCGPVGQVLEMKLNMPKENSVVIRFAQASYAEKFYNLYHGLKFNNSFLNVILV